MRPLNRASGFLRRIRRSLCYHEGPAECEQRTDRHRHVAV